MKAELVRLLCIIINRLILKDKNSNILESEKNESERKEIIYSNMPKLRSMTFE
jgi:hypothetical protein